MVSKREWYALDSFPTTLYVTKIGRPAGDACALAVYYIKSFGSASTVTLDAGSNKNIKDIEILLKRNWNFPKHIFNKNIERNI